MSDLNAGQGASSEASAAATSNGTASASSGTTQPSGEAGQGATGSENFLPQGVDINTLPPAVRAELDRINKEMVRGFTAKTQELAEQRKKYEGYDTYKQKADLYEQIASQEEFVRQWNEYVKKVGGQGQAGQGDPNDPNVKLQAEVQEIKTELERAKAGEIVEAFSSAKDEKTGELLHPDFEALHSVVIGGNEKVGEYSLLRAAVDLAPGATQQERLANGYKAAKAVRDAILEEGRKQGMGKMLARARNSSEAPTLSTEKGVFTGDPKNLSAREARELAEKRVVVR